MSRARSRAQPGRGQRGEQGRDVDDALRGGAGGEEELDAFGIVPLG